MRQSPLLETDRHALYIGNAGVTLVDTKHDALLFLEPTESVQLARLILEREHELLALSEQLREQYEQLSQTVLQAFDERVEQAQAEWQQNRPLLPLDSWWKDFDIDQELRAAFNQLLARKEGMVWQWYQSIWTDRYSHEQHEALFWRYFARTHSAALISKYLPADDIVGQDL